MEHKSHHKVVYSCKYQVVWGPKYCRRVLTSEVAERLKAILHAVAQERQAKIVELKVMPDGVRLKVVTCDARCDIRHAKAMTVLARGGSHGRKKTSKKRCTAETCIAGPVSGNVSAMALRQKPSQSVDGGGFAKPVICYPYEMIRICRYRLYLTQEQATFRDRRSWVGTIVGIRLSHRDSDLSHPNEGR
ncbi:MAG: hypothetical protein C7B45_09240 [Sulfobacillus acidophilus]|uniref:Transposase IS200-like domain-containing protein n=1 Tax=Sulfobacillus acidophilus TaxID=53633 RepID=A0A2T2WHZ7_9FIRM|nr:MAG: hypothetical protein C7B45_09240 [Sulfobacillus acidophilus]